MNDHYDLGELDFKDVELIRAALTDHLNNTAAALPHFDGLPHEAKAAVSANQTRTQALIERCHDVVRRGPRVDPASIGDSVDAIPHHGVLYRLGDRFVPAGEEHPCYMASWDTCGAGAGAGLVIEKGPAEFEAHSGGFLGVATSPETALVAIIRAHSARDGLGVLRRYFTPAEGA